MKKTLFLTLLVVVGCVFASKAQKTTTSSVDHPSTFSLQVGSSLFALANSDLEKYGNVGDSVYFAGGKVSGTPTFQVAYDYQTNSWFSIGLAGSYNTMSMSLNDLQLLDKKIGSGTVNLSRTSLALRTLFHYGTKPRLDMYSGLRFGVGVWSAGTSGNFDLKDIDGINLPNRLPNLNKARFTLPQIQVIPFALRGYVTENIGLNFELALGAPYFLSGGVNFRL